MNRLTLIFALVLTCLGADAQTDSTHLKTLAGALAKLSATRPTEKVYLQINKPNYDLGDTVWFKAYVTVGEHHQPSALSGVLYVELLDAVGKTVQSLQLKNDNGVAAGEMALGSKLKIGSYHIRAYTNWMRNAGPEYFYNRTITVGDAATDALFVTPTLTFDGSNDVQTKLTYSDKLGRPFNQKPVNYEVRADTNLLYRGKGVTNDKGNISFTFQGKTAPKQQVRLISHIRVVAGVTVDKTILLNIANEDADVQFFPEGGSLINDVRSKVAFKAIGTNGLGIDISGTVIDNENNEIANFKSTHAGMGYFAFTPQANKTYTAKISFGDQTITKQLPTANDKGFVLAVNNNDSTKLSIRIGTNEATLKEKQNTSFYIIGQSNGQVYFASQGKLDNQTFSFSVPKDRFPSGIAQFTLFDGNNQPLNERITFIQNKADILNLNLTSAKSSYSGKEKVDLNLIAKDNQNKSISGSFSVTVYNEDNTPANENTEHSILSDLLLTSDLQGNVEEPNYYFNTKNDQSQTKADLDVLMLTQGYRRFDWQSIINNNSLPIAYQPEKSLTLSGKLTDDNNKPVTKGTVKALLTRTGFSTETSVNEKGQFTLAGFDLTDSAKLVLQGKRANGDRYVNINVNGKTSPGLIRSNLMAQSANCQPNITGSLTSAPISANADSNSISTSIKNNPFRFNKENTLKDVVIKQQRKNYGTEFAPWQIPVTHSDNLNGPGHADQVLGYEELGECFELTDCLLARVHGLMKITGGLGYARNVASSFHAAAVVFIVDGAVVGTNPEKVEDIINGVGNIMTIEVLKNRSYLSVYGSTAPGGAMIITTKKGTEGLYTGTWEKEAPGILTSEFKGYDVAKQFYVPKYTVQNQSMPDTRDAIYWNPNVITDEKGTQQLTFYNSDVKGIYRAVVEGIDNDGNIGRCVYRYVVK